MNQFNTTTIDSVLLRVKRYNFNYNSHKADVIIAIGDAIGEIGRHAGFINRVAKDVPVANYKAKKPIDSVEIKWVFYMGDELPYSSDQRTYSYAENPPTQTLVEEEDPITTMELSKEVDRYNDLLEQLEDDPTNEALQDAAADSLNKINSMVRKLKLTTSPTDDIIDSYNFNGQYITTTFPTGYLDIHYKSYLVDKSTGLPLIIDTPKYKNAIVWYIIKELLLMGYNHPVISYEYADQKWEDTREAARNEQIGSYLPKEREFMQFMQQLSLNGEVLENIY